MPRTSSPAGLDKDFVFTLSAENLDKPRAIAAPDPVEAYTTNLMDSLIPKVLNIPSQTPEIVFVVERSGSMRGNRIEAVKSSLLLFLASLTPGINFNLCSLGSSFSFLFPPSMPYSAETLKVSQDHANEMSADYGGTEMLAPLKATTDQRIPGSNFEVLFLTDGEVFDNKYIANYVESAAAEKVRFFTLGIAETVTHSIVESIARAGRGYAQTVQPGERCHKKVIRMLKAALTPHIEDWAIDWEGKKELESSDNLVALQSPFRIPPPMFHGVRSSVYFTFPSPPPKEIHLTGTYNKEKIITTIPVLALSKPCFSMRSIYGHLDHQDLSEGRIPEHILSKEAIGTHATHVGLRFQLASRLTSFITVDEK